MTSAKILGLSIAIALGGCAGGETQIRSLESGGALRVEPSPAPGADYVVTIRNVRDFDFDPDDKPTRDDLALRTIRPQCAGARVVGESVISTGSYATGRPARTYSLRIKC